MVDVKVSKDKYIIADGLIDKTSYMLDEIESKTVHKDKEDCSLLNPSNAFVFGDFNVHHEDWLTYSGRTDRPG